MAKLSKEKADKAFDDGFRDARHGEKPNTPHQDWHPLIREEFRQKNLEYKKGYNAGAAAKKK